MTQRAEEPEVAEAVLAADSVAFATLQSRLDAFEESGKPHGRCHGRCVLVTSLLKELRAALEGVEGRCALASAQQKEEEEKLNAEQMELSRLTEISADSEAVEQGVGRKGFQLAFNSFNTTSHRCSETQRGNLQGRPPGPGARRGDGRGRR